MQEGLKNRGGHWDNRKLTLADKVLMDLIPEDGVLTSRQDISEVLGVSWDTANSSLRRLSELGLVNIEAERRKAVVIRRAPSDKCQEVEQ